MLSGRMVRSFLVLEGGMESPAAAMSMMSKMSTHEESMKAWAWMEPQIPHKPHTTLS